ncbi:MAG: hypothetical protein LH615_01190 [Ferruginibacter sp.]|nr:hypothetical protein [Ferruginibacter sp.]
MRSSSVTKASALYVSFSSFNFLVCASSLAVSAAVSSPLFTPCLILCLSFLAVLAGLDAVTVYAFDE